MKKVLIATTALVASAGFASAELALTGEAKMYATYDSARAQKTMFMNQVDLNVVGSGTTDGGLSFGASLDLESDNDGANGTVATNRTNDGEVFISGAFGKLTVGNIDPATDGLGIADPGLDGIGIDNVAEINKTQGNAEYAQYTGTFDAFTIILSTSTLSTSNDTSAVIKYDFGDIDAALGYARDGSSGGATTMLDVNGKFGDYGFEAFFADENTAGGNIDAYGLAGSYTMGATTITVAIADNTTAGVDAAYGIGASYNLGGGATLAGGIGSVDAGAARKTVADFGVKFKF